MEKAKVICICGSLKFLDQIKIQAEKLELEGNCVLSIIYPAKEDKGDYTQDELQLLGALHKQRIDMSDAVFIVNVNGYTGISTRSEIEYADKAGKEVIYLEEKI